MRKKKRNKEEQNISIIDTLQLFKPHSRARVTPSKPGAKYLR